MLLGTFSASLCHLEPPQTPGAGGAGVFCALGEGAEVAAGGRVPAGPGPAAERSFVYSASVVELHHIQ